MSSNEKDVPGAIYGNYVASLVFCLFVFVLVHVHYPLPGSDREYLTFLTCPQYLFYFNLASLFYLPLAHGSAHDPPNPQRSGRERAKRFQAEGISHMAKGKKER